MGTISQNPSPLRGLRPTALAGNRSSERFEAKVPEVAMRGRDDAIRPVHAPRASKEAGGHPAGPQNLKSRET